MKGQCRKKADDTLRYSLGCLCEAVMLSDGGIGKHIESPAYTLNNPTVTQGSERMPWYALRCKVPGAKYTSFTY